MISVVGSGAEPSSALFCRRAYKATHAKRKRLAPEWLTEYSVNQFAEMRKGA